MSESRSLEISQLPSQAQLALALAIVKSKPPNTTIKDYLRDIKNHVKAGRRQQDETNQGHHIDSAAFWRKAYEKSEAMQSRLLDKIYELEQRSEAATIIAKPLGTDPVSAKRKASEEPRVFRILKRSRTTVDMRTTTRQPECKLNPVGLSTGGEVLENATTPFLRRLYSLQKLLQRRSEPELLGTACADVCLAIENLLPPSIPPKRARTTNSNKSTVQQPQHPKLSEILVAVDRCHPFILQAFAKVSGNGQEKGASGLIVYYYVRLFQSLLSYLHQHALSKSRWLLNKKKSSGKKSRQVTQSNTANAQVYSSVQLSREDNKIMDSVSRTLAKLILAIDVRKRAHYSLLEGVLCVLLNHIGNVLSMLVFKELRSNPSLRTCPSKLPVPSSNSDETMNRTGVSVAETAAMLQTSYLVWILERAMLTVDHPCCAHESGTGNSNDISTHSFTDVLGDAKRRLQNTLLKGVFGLNDPEFQESLNPPKEVSGSSFTERTAGNVELSNNENQDPGGWFVGEIWRLLGWDSLMDGQEC